jgi:hypothetical protein
MHRLDEFPQSMRVHARKGSATEHDHRVHGVGLLLLDRTFLGAKGGHLVDRGARLALPDTHTHTHTHTLTHTHTHGA